jgi:hypothetical protein
LHIKRQNLIIIATMDEDIQTPNLSNLPDTEATALANNPYYQPRIWDWAYENGQPPVWPKPWKGKGKERRRKSGSSGRRSSVCARFAVMFRRRNSRGFEGSDVEEETTIEGDVEGGKGLALDKVTTPALEVIETTAEDRVGDQK